MLTVTDNQLRHLCAADLTEAASEDGKSNLAETLSKSEKQVRRKPESRKPVT